MRPESNSRRDIGDLNEQRVTRELRMSRREITIQPANADDVFTGPIVWSDINNIAILVQDRIKVFVKSNIEHWDYAASS